MDRMDEPKPAYNTVSTIVRILETKGFVGHNAYGKTHEYFPLVEKDQYSKVRLKSMVTNYFSNSFKELVSFFTNENKLDITELEELKKIIEDEMKKKS
jgi:predicted transcriptional regulator